MYDEQKIAKLEEELKNVRGETQHHPVLLKLITEIQDLLESLKKEHELRLEIEATLVTEKRLRQNAEFSLTNLKNNYENWNSQMRKVISNVGGMSDEGKRREMMSQIMLRDAHWADAIFQKTGVMVDLSGNENQIRAANIPSRAVGELFTAIEKKQLIGNTD